jgi:hypothetical protein
MDPFHQTDHDPEEARLQGSVDWGCSLSFCLAVEELAAQRWAWRETSVPEIQT